MKKKFLSYLSFTFFWVDWVTSSIGQEQTRKFEKISSDKRIKSPDALAETIGGRHTQGEGKT